MKVTKAMVSAVCSEMVGCGWIEESFSDKPTQQCLECGHKNSGMSDFEREDIRGYISSFLQVAFDMIPTNRGKSAVVFEEGYDAGWKLGYDAGLEDGHNEVSGVIEKIKREMKL